LGDASYDVLTNSLFDSRVHKTYGGKIVDEQYSPAGLAVPLAIKDLRLALAEAERCADACCEPRPRSPRRDGSSRVERP
jgi:3-hydroxyisobutyrate dehydrogenase-like beta-hydroxyacid dehydrogenase